jgi:hypothetical protein
MEGSFPMPLIDDVLDKLGESAWFVTLDFQFGFWQIRMALEDIEKTIIITKSALYEWSVMPFGLKNVTGTFSQAMAKVC